MEDPEKPLEISPSSTSLDINEPQNVSNMSPNSSVEGLIICKTDQQQESNASSIQINDVEEFHQNHEKESPSVRRNHGIWSCCKNVDHLLVLGLAQVVFGFLMVVFGILVILWNANFSQIGCGLWGGLIAMSCGITGLLASNKRLTSTEPKYSPGLAHIIFLILSLVSLATSQLVVAITATGLSRDIAKFRNEIVFYEITTVSSSEEPEKVVLLSQDSYGLFFNLGLLIVSSIACVLAIISCYKNVGLLCTCFRKKDFLDELNECPRYELINSWLVMASPGRSDKEGKLIRRLPSPVFTIPPPTMPPIIPLIPAPLGPVPSPVIPPVTRRDMIRKHRRRNYLVPLRSHHQNPNIVSMRRHSGNIKHPKERKLTKEELVKTYTGLDKTIAEQFIDICESRNSSLYGGDSNCGASSTTCQSQTYCSNDNDDKQLIAKS